MKSLIRFAQLTLAATTLLIATAPAHAETPNLDFDLVNKTGYDIKEVYVAPSNVDNWEENILSEPLKNDETLEVKFSPEHKATKWDLKIVWADGGDAVYWKGYDLSEISKISLFYDENTDKTSAKTE